MGEEVGREQGEGPAVRGDRPARPVVPAPATDGLAPAVLTRLNEAGFRLIQVADALALLTIMVVTNLVRYGTSWEQETTYPASLHAASFGIAVAVFLVTFYFGGLYEREPRLGRPSVLPRTARVSAFATGTLLLASFVATSLSVRYGVETSRALPLPLLNLFVLLVVGAMAAAGNRRMAQWARYNREGPPRVLLVGTPDDVTTARLHLRDDQERAVVVGESSATTDIVAAARAVGATDVALVSPGWLEHLYAATLGNLEAAGITVLQRVTARETLYGLQRVRQVGGMPFVLLRSHTLPVSRARSKRAVELALVLLASPVLVLVVGAVALYALAVVGRPILFWQERVGRDGVPFRMVKFRTMYPDAEEDGSPQLATRDDPRIVPACGWLRATRLDELPQLWNVILGEMSLVGPRPERPELTSSFEELIPGYARRHEIPPGITGLAQIHGRYDTDPEYKLGYDLQYLVNWSPVLDLEILARTVWVVLARRI